MSHTVTYCPEDDKLRLYVGRVPRDEYERLRKAGYVSTPKQDCDFAAVWTPQREDLASEYLDDEEDIGDEDYSPLERADDRAERYEGYRDKRRAEAVGHADAFDAGPSVHGHQSAKVAERSARKHDRERTRAVSQWSKAEYWQHRSRGVLTAALYKSRPDVRRRRILTIEKEIRKIEASYTPRLKKGQTEPQTIMQHSQAAEYDYKTQTYDREPEPHVYVGAGRGGYWEAVAALPGIKERAQRWLTHLQMRLIYENTMLDEEGGKASEVEIEPGGWFGSLQIHKVNKSRQTGRVVSVMVPGQWGFAQVAGTRQYLDHANAAGLCKMNIEGLPEDAYTPPTDEERAQFAAAKKAKPKAPPLLNPTPEDARRLQDIWNSQHPKYEPRPVVEMTQQKYSDYSRGGDFYHTATLTKDGRALYYREHVTKAIAAGQAVCRLRMSQSLTGPGNVIILTDKPQKALPVEWPQETAAETFERSPEAIAAGTLF